MKELKLKSFLPHIVAIVIFVAISMAYFLPLLEGKQLKQGDVLNFQGASKEIVDYRAAHPGKEALWTNRMFGGMPAYQISVLYPSNLVKYIDKVFHLGLPHPAGILFIYFLGFYILLLVLRVNWKLGIIGAVAFAFSSYFLIIIEAGHNTKALAIGYMAPVIAGIILCFRGRYIAGGALTVLFLALEINANHVQITYYLMIIVVILVIAEFISKIREKQLKVFFTSVLILIAAAIIALGTSITNLWLTYEYGKYSTRSKSELTSDKENKTTGLDRDYATDWSYGKTETFTLLIPDYMGGASHSELSKNSDTYKALKEKNIDNPDKIVKSLPVYWGPQPFTSGPVYVGAIMVFLFILGLFLVKGKYKWWLLSATVLSICLAWGRNMMWFTNFFFDYVPGYNKFRAVSMTLVIAELCIPLLGLLAFQNIFNRNIAKEAKIKALKFAGSITLGIIVVFGFLSGGFFDFVADGDAGMIANGYPDWLVSSLQSDRHNVLLADSLRSFIFIALAGAALWLYAANKIKNANIVIAIAGGLVLVDMWAVDKRYVNSDNFVNKSRLTATFTKSKCDEAVLSDKTLNYRVLNFNNPFNDAYTSYYHNSVGGYHGAKLKRYQELIETRIYEELSKLKAAFSSKRPDSAVVFTLNECPVINMMNTKYIIISYQDGTQYPYKNQFALGNAWFADEYKLVANADSELAAMKHFEPMFLAIVDKRFESMVSKFKYQKDEGASIKLSSYEPNYLVYQTKSTKEHLAVFSEIYYDKGWNVYIDGKLSPYFRCNYVLRGMIVPAGNHKIEWKFEPAAYITGEKISLVSGILLIIVVAGGFIYEILKGKKKEVEKAK